MSIENQVLVIDAGNTIIKIARFINGVLATVERTTLPEFENFIKENEISEAVISSVLSEKETATITQYFKSPLLVSNQSKLPISLNYHSPETLGIDRICNAVYASKQIEKGFALTIDIGTCIKFDLVKANGEYLGGSISPGLALRYKSLHDYTSELPLISEKSKTELLGKDTNSSIHSGVINGINAEIYRLMEQYSAQFEDLTFFVTGGDARCFDIHSKNDIFAVENLTLLGLYEIYVFNA
ncbi:MAG: type III pantothenate kinase [Fluviicola sp.]|nr:type III pantothenate kinase [Fluviicola sp.]